MAFNALAIVFGIENYHLHLIKTLKKAKNKRNILNKDDGKKNIKIMCL